MDSKNPYMNSTIAYLRLDSPKNVKSAPKKPFWTWTKIGLIISFVMLILLFFQYYDRLGLKSKVGDIEKDIEKFLKDEFEDFRKQHDKVYETIEEYEKRFKIFVENLKRVRASKKIFGMSPLLDRSIDEFKPLMMPTSYHKKIQKSISKLPLAMVEDFEEFYDIDDDDLDVPRSMDWRSRKLVTPVKNQLQCGSCWAFATAAIVETQNALSTGQLMSLSEQQMVDCFGWCNGTYVDDALGYIKMNGLTTDKIYPYVGKVQKCRNIIRPNTTPNVRIQSFLQTSRSEVQIANYVATKGPVAFTMQLTDIFPYVTKEIYDPDPVDCYFNSIGAHAMAIVGFGSENKNDYWIVKNSWGTRFGDGGYFKLRRGVNACGMANWVYGLDVKND